MDNIIQIVASFLSIFAAIFIGYVIYLYSAAANTEQRIQEQGCELVNSLDEIPPLSIKYLFDFGHILQEYGATLPEKEPLDFVIEFSNDLYQAVTGVSDKKKQQIEQLVQKHLANDVALGYLSIWTIQRLVGFLHYYDLMEMKDMKFIESFTLEEYLKNKELYPFGLSGVQPWLSTFKKVKHQIEIFLRIEKDILSSIESQDKKQADSVHNNTNQELSKWFSAMKQWLAELSRKVRIADTMSIHLDDLSVSKRIKNLNWIIALIIVSFIIGILAPFLMENLIPNIPKGLIVGWFFFSIGILAATYIVFITDMVGYKSSKEMFKVYLAPLELELRHNCIHWRTRPTFRTQELNRFIKNSKQSGVDKNLLNEAISVQKSLLNTNKASKKLAEEFKSKFLSKNFPKETKLGKTHQKSLVLEVYDPKAFSADIALLEKTKNQNVTVLLYSNSRGMRHIIAEFTDSMPKDERNQLIIGLNEAYEEVMSLPEAQECIKSINQSVQEMQRLHDIIQNKIAISTRSQLKMASGERL